jgi:hypothetical protein
MRFHFAKLNCIFRPEKKKARRENPLPTSARHNHRSRPKGEKLKITRKSRRKQKKIPFQGEMKVDVKVEDVKAYRRPRPKNEPE